MAGMGVRCAFGAFSLGSQIPRRMRYAAFSILSNYNKPPLGVARKNEPEACGSDVDDTQEELQLGTARALVNDGGVVTDWKGADILAAALRGRCILVLPKQPDHARTRDRSQCSRGYLESSW